MNRTHNQIQPSFSVIIPVYNSAPYLSRCIESIRNQSYKGSYELILVDDGSTDGSDDLCRRYSQQYQNISFIKQNNQGVSTARNVGMRAAGGEYLVFVDSDDFVDRNLLKQLAVSDADMVICGFFDYQKDHIVKYIRRKNEIFSLHSENGMVRYLNINDNVFVWGRRYKKSIIDQGHIRFDETMKAHEDILFNNAYILQCAHSGREGGNIECLNYQGYYHCQYTDHDTLSSSSERHSFLEQNLFRIKAYKQFEGYPKVQDIYARQFLYFMEREFVSIAKGQYSLVQKRNAMQNILQNSFVQKCLRKDYGVLPKDARWLCHHRMTDLLIAKYKRA